MPRVNSWTAAEDDQLRSQYATTKNADLAQALGRTMGSIQQRAYELELKKPQAYLTKKRPAGPAYRPAVRAALLAAAAAGLSLDEAEVRVREANRFQINLTLNRLVATGHAWKVGKAAEARWFDEPGYAQAWAASRGEPAPAVRQRAPKKPSLARSAEIFPQPPKVPVSARPDPNAEPVRTERTIETKAATPPAHRFEVVGKVVGGLASAGIGRYKEPASSWVRAVTGRGA